MRVRGEWNASMRRVEFEYATSRIRVRDEARVRRYLRADFLVDNTGIQLAIITYRMTSRLEHRMILLHNKH